MKVATGVAVLVMESDVFHYSEAQRALGEIAGSVAFHGPIAYVPVQTNLGGTRCDQTISVSQSAVIVLSKLFFISSMISDRTMCLHQMPSGPGRLAENMNEMRQA